MRTHGPEGDEMTAQKHTPGEWAVYEGQWGDHGDDEGGGFQIIMGPYDGGSIHTHRLINYAEGIFPEDKAYQEAQANARLIAAAPEMLKALKVVASSGSWRCFVDDEWDIVNDAIAKAEGRP